MKKVIFFGFGKLGSDCMKALLENGYQINYVMTHKENEITSVDTYSHEKGIEYSYLDSRKNLKDIYERIKNISPNFLVSVNYRYIIPKEIFNMVDYALNIHGSLLPRYRGRTPHIWSIINGEIESGITCHLIEESVDKGDIILQKKIRIEPEDTGFSLLKKFESYYPSLLMDSIEMIINGSKHIKQNDRLASYYGKRTPDMGYIDFRKNASDVVNFIRAQADPYPGAYYFLLDGRKIIINKIAIHEMNDYNIEIGVIIDLEDCYFVRCKDHMLKIVDYRVIN